MTSLATVLLCGGYQRNHRGDREADADFALIRACVKKELGGTAPSVTEGRRDLIGVRWGLYLS